MAGFNNESVSEINLGIKGTSISSSSGVNYNVSNVIGEKGPFIAFFHRDPLYRSLKNPF